MTNENKIATYILKQALGTLSEEEREELETWRTSSEVNQQLYTQFSKPDQIILEFSLRNERNKRIATKLEQFIEKNKPATDSTSIHFIRRWSWAAAVLIGISFGTWFFWNSDHAGKTVVASQDTSLILPGKEGAILTLADGTQYSLDSIQNGTVALQDGITAKVVNGMLQYEGKSDKPYLNTMTTPKGRLYQLSLPDGSKAWLNSASSIQYPTVFSKQHRTVKISGEVYFDIAKDPSRPFHVTVDDKMSIDVLGTQFNVNTYDKETAIYTTLIEGAVRVVDQFRQPGNAALLKPAQQAVLAFTQAGSNRSAMSVAHNIDVDKVMAWKNGLFNFEGASLQEVMKQLERWYDIEVIYEKGIPDIKFWGKITKDVPLSGMLIALEKTKVRFRLEENRKLVVLP